MKKNYVRKGHYVRKTIMFEKKVEKKVIKNACSKTYDYRKIIKKKYCHCNCKEY